MLRWTLQPRRVAGGCASIQHALRISATVTLGHGGTSSTRPLSRCPNRPLSSSRHPAADETSNNPAESAQRGTASIIAIDHERRHVTSSSIGSVTPPIVHTVHGAGGHPRHDRFSSALSRLQEFLHRPALKNSTPRFSARELRHLYLSWKREGEGGLRRLTSCDMSSLISLFGSLSLSTPGKHYDSIHAHRRLPDMPSTSIESHWSLVLGICRDKRWLRYPLLPSDVYWLMRARLLRFWQYVENSDCNASEIWLSAARRCYEVIRDSSSHPDVHLPYIKALLAIPTPQHIDEIATHIAAIFSQSRGLHPSIRSVVFRSVLLPQGMGALSRQAILSAVAEHLMVHRDGVSSTGGGTSRAHEELALPMARSLPHDARGLAMVFEHAIFDDPSVRPRVDTIANQVHGWSRTIACRVFLASDQNNDALWDLRWNCFVLLALVRTRSSHWHGQSAEVASDPVQRAATIEWQTVCVLATMENLFGGMRTPPSESPTAEVVQGFSGILRRLWHDWSTIPVSDALPRPLYISRLVCASFVKLAGLIKDKTLLDTCREYCDTAGLWLIQDSYPISTAGLQALATEQLHAALMCGTFFERALVDLVVCTTDMNILRGAVDTAILRHARFDPEHAQELLAWATHRGIAPSSKVIVRVGIALARRGDSGHLERYVSHPRLEADERAQVANAYLRMYAMHGRRFIAPRAFAIAAPDMMLLSTEVSDSKLLFKHLWAALLVLLREGHAARAVSLAKDLASRHQSTISGAHYTELLSTLLRHRHFELAHAVLVDWARLQPDSASRWRAMFFHRACTVAPRLAPRLVKVERRIRWRAMPIIRTARSRKAAIVWSLHLPKVYGRASDPATACRAIRILARLGRMRAAKMLYERICQEESPEVRTAAGNMILHGATQRLDRARSPAQRVRTVAYVYKTLVEKYAFVPDRVTVNILLKMLLLGKQLDAAQTRGLFDAVVRMGYPSGRAMTQDKRGTPKGAFDTSSTESVLVGDVAVPRLATRLMYARHVRPLYKSFIKAFYVLGDAQAARRVVGILKTLETGKASHLAKGQDWVVGGGGGQRQTGA